ncbi:hypothetical protein BJX99DRAFT_259155 [Aspergillus californicus]
MKRDSRGDTVWHLAAAYSPGCLEALLEKTPDPSGRLIEANNEGYTPITRAILAGNGLSFILLLPHCGSAEYFVGPVSPYEAALHAEKTEMTDVIEKLIAANIPLVHRTSPIHQVRITSSVDCVRLLKYLHPDACEERHNSRLPIENLLTQLPDSLNKTLPKQLLVMLIPRHEMQTIECWDYFCSDVFPDFGRAMIKR